MKKTILSAFLLLPLAAFGSDSGGIKRYTCEQLDKANIMAKSDLKLTGNVLSDSVLYASSIYVNSIKEMKRALPAKESEFYSSITNKFYDIEFKRRANIACHNNPNKNITNVYADVSRELFMEYKDTPAFVGSRIYLGNMSHYYNAISNYIASNPNSNFPKTYSDAITIDDGIAILSKYANENLNGYPISVFNKVEELARKTSNAQALDEINESRKKHEIDFLNNVIAEKPANEARAVAASELLNVTRSLSGLISSYPSLNYNSGLKDQYDSNKLFKPLRDELYALRDFPENIFNSVMKAGESDYTSLNHLKYKISEMKKHRNKTISLFGNYDKLVAEGDDFGHILYTHNKLVKDAGERVSKYKEELVNISKLISSRKDKASQDKLRNEFNKRIDKYNNLYRQSATEYNELLSKVPNKAEITKNIEIAKMKIASNFEKLIAISKS